MAQSYENFRTGLGDRLLREDAWRDVEKIAKNHSMGSVSFKDGRVKVDAFSASALVAVYNALKKSNQKKFIEVINSSADGLQQMLQFAFDSVNPAGKIKESIELHEINIDALWQKFLKKFKLREFDKSERARAKKIHKSNVKWNKMMGIAASVEHDDDEESTLTEKIYDPMYYDAGMNNDANKDKFIKTMRKHRLTVVTRGKTGTIEVFPKQGSDKQTIFKYAKVYGMIAVKESVEVDEAFTSARYGGSVHKPEKTNKGSDPRIGKMSKQAQEILAHMANSLETTGGPWLDITNVKFLTTQGVDNTLKKASKIKGLPPQAKKDLALIKKELGESVEVELDESKMSELHMLIKQGKSAEQIAKIMKVDVKTIKELMKESVDELGEGVIKIRATDRSKVQKFLQKNKIDAEWGAGKGSTYTLELDKEDTAEVRADLSRKGIWIGESVDELDEAKDYRKELEKRHAEALKIIWAIDTTFGRTKWTDSFDKYVVTKMPDDVDTSIDAGWSYHQNRGRGEWFFTIEPRDVVKYSYTGKAKINSSEKSGRLKIGEFEKFISKVWALTKAKNESVELDEADNWVLSFEFHSPEYTSKEGRAIQSDLRKKFKTYSGNGSMGAGWDCTFDGSKNELEKAKKYVETKYKKYIIAKDTELIKESVEHLDEIKWDKDEKRIVPKWEKDLHKATSKIKGIVRGLKNGKEVHSYRSGGTMMASAVGVLMRDFGADTVELVVRGKVVYTVKKKDVMKNGKMIDEAKKSDFKVGDKVTVADKSHKLNGQSGKLTKVASKIATVKMDKGGKTIIFKSISLWQDK